MYPLYALNVPSLHTVYRYRQVRNMVGITNIGYIVPSFLLPSFTNRYRQVRNMVGMLVDVGLGHLSPDDVSYIIKAEDRTIAPATAPAHGLYLTNVRYK